jgi:hypothetical protein
MPDTIPVSFLLGRRQRNMRPIAGLFAALVLSATTVRGEVVASAPHGFSIRLASTVTAAPAHVYETFVKEIGSWWDSDHTFFGSAQNLSIDAQPGGCFCEVVSSERSVRLMSVVFVDSGRTLRMQGGLGPLLGMGVQGALTLNIMRADPGSSVELVYNVGGFSADGLDKIAPAVDRVLGEQLNRLKRYIETGKPD